MLEGANMDENGNDGGRTAMERLARMLGECVLSCDDSAARWAEAHGIDCDDVLYTVIRDDARSDIKRRIEDASAEDDCSDSYAAAALKALTGMHRGHAMCTRDEVDEMVAVVEGWKAKAAELDALKAAGRVMPEGLSWPRYADGEPVRVGDVLRTRGRSRHLFRVVGVAPGDGGMAVVCEDMDEGGELCYMDPDLLARERPDSWEKLREDALKTVYAYWGCEGMPCNLCPAKIGDERPCDHYGTGTSCTDAIRLDLVARAERLAGVSADA